MIWQRPLLGSLVCALLVGCAAQQESSPSSTPPRPEPVWTQAAPPEPSPARVEAVAIRGIEGSMSSYDVNETMERRGSELAACHEARARLVPALCGAIEYSIAVDAEGQVGEVTVRRSDIGDRALERCIIEVIRGSPFPRPNGGDARFTWSLTLEPSSERVEPEAWEPEQVEEARSKQLPDLHEACGLKAQARRLAATAYVNKRGRVVAAGISGKSRASDDDLDCIVRELTKWKMPKPKRRFAKVKFSLAAPKKVATRPRRARKR